MTSPSPTGRIAVAAGCRKRQAPRSARPPCIQARRSPVPWSDRARRCRFLSATRPKCSAFQSTTILRLPTPRKPPKSITAARTTPPRSTITSTIMPHVLVGSAEDVAAQHAVRFPGAMMVTEGGGAGGFGAGTGVAAGAGAAVCGCVAAGGLSAAGGGTGASAARAGAATSAEQAITIDANTHPTRIPLLQ